jgi:hypothetical protein
LAGCQQPAAASRRAFSHDPWRGDGQRLVLWGSDAARTGY